MLTLLLMPTAAKADEIPDIVVDETLTFYGGHFYEEFRTGMENSNVSDYGQLTVGERPYLNSGSLVSISYRGETLIEMSIFAADRNIDYNASAAVSTVINKIRTKLFFDKFFPNPDLVGDGF